MPPSDTVPEPTTQLHPEDRRPNTPKKIINLRSSKFEQERHNDVLLTLWSATPKNEIPVYKAWVRALSWCPSAVGQTVKGTVWDTL